MSWLYYYHVKLNAIGVNFLKCDHFCCGFRFKKKSIYITFIDLMMLDER